MQVVAARSGGQPWAGGRGRRHGLGVFGGLAEAPGRAPVHTQVATTSPQWAVRTEVPQAAPWAHPPLTVGPGLCSCSFPLSP